MSRVTNLVTIVEIVSKGNKSGRKAFEFLTQGVHLLILDLQPTTAQSGESVRAFVKPVEVGDRLIDMPLFLDPGRYVAVPLEETYLIAFDSVPKRWRKVLDPG